MKRYTWLLQSIALILMIMLMSGCGTSPSPTPIPTFTSVPLPEIETTMGILVITEVQLSDRAPSGNRADEGYQALIIWLERKDKAEIDSDAGFKLLDQGIYAVADNGARTQFGMVGLTETSSSIFSGAKMWIAATPKVSERNFKLLWPDNTPIDLGK
jgi:hypothetical protein